MKQTIKRMTVLLLVFSLVFGMIPAVSAADAQPKTATLVTDVSALSAGDQIIIVAAAGEYALSTTQNKNNRGQAAITMSDDGKRVTYSADTQVITLEAGTAANTFAFVVGVEKYLNATSSSSNYLKTGTALTDNGSWTITIDENGIANVVAGGTYTRNTLRYNASSGLFACYAAENTQKDISIYKLDAAGVAPGDCDHSWSQGICILCGDVCGHDYVDNTCTICGSEKPETTEPVTEPVETEPAGADYYLFGWINGANYGCEEDYTNLGEYKFVNGKVTATFNETSYVAVKTGDNAGWYMTDGWLGEVTSATLHSTAILGENANKLMVPGGVKVTFTLVDNGDDTFTLSYTTASEPDTTEPVTEPVETEPETQPTEPSIPEMTLNKVTKLEQLEEATKVVLVAQVDGTYKALGTAIAGKITPVTVNVADGTVTADGAAIWNVEATQAGYALRTGNTYLAYNSSTNFKADTAAYEWGFTAGENGGFLVESTATTRGAYYQISGDRFGAYATSNAANKDYVSELLVFADVEPVIEDPTEPTEPETEPTEPETEPTTPAAVDYYLFGWINGADYGCEGDSANLGEYKFVNGKLTATFKETSYVAVKTGDNAGWYMTDGWQGEVTSVTLYNTLVLDENANKLMVPGGVEVTFTLVDNGDDTFTLSYEITTIETEPTEPETEPTEPETEPTEPETEPTEPETEPTTPAAVDYYLFGWINGADYACEGDSANLGEYKFVNGKLTATFKETSYVAVKTGDNAGWYMTDGWQGEVTSVTLYNTLVLDENANKLMVPGGVEVTFTLVDNGDDTFTLSYEITTIETEPTEPETTEPVVLPTITLKYPTLSFESEVYYNVYFSATNVADVVEMGLLTWYNRPANTAAATYESAEAVISGAIYNEGANMYMVRSEGVPAKQLGDNMYIRVYAKLTDGTYAYSPVTYYNAVMYANDILANSQSAEMKSLVVAMLNYGAAAQVHFNHNTDKLMNAGLTPEQKALVKAYSSDMIGSVIAADANKVGTFKSNGGFSGAYPSVSFEGAFAINFYLLPKQTVESDMILYCWDLNTYNSVDVLTEENATAKITMINGGTRFAGAYEGIAAKQIDETVFVAAVYETDGVRYSSPVISYSLGAYCKDQIANGSDTMKAFAAETAVYGHYAKAYFASLNG